MLTFERRISRRVIALAHSGFRLFLLTTIVAMTVMPLSVFASDNTPSTSLANAAKNRAVSDRVAEAIDISFYRPPALPPLPFSEPQVGPVIKRSLETDIESWTTAFIPADGKFTPDFEMPDEDKWIRVDLNQQLLFAYERDKPVRAFVISSGLPRTPTVTGEFRIRMKVRSQTMSGGDPELGNDYELPNVQWVQYFHEDYGFHGTYWHNNFGNPMSHGCVNMTNTDARWLFNWAGPAWEETGRIWQRSTEEDPGTFVIVHE